MRFTFTDEQAELRAVLRRFLNEQAPVDSARTALDVGYDPNVWRSLAQDLGLHGMAVPETLGGQGWGIVELALAMEELGRVLYPGPFFASAVVATRVLIGAGGDELLAPLMAGERVATLAAADDGRGWRADAVAAVAEDGPGGAEVVTGHKRLVVSASDADDLLVVARRPGTAGDDGLVLVAVDLHEASVEVTSLEGIDATRPQADVHLDAAPARLVAESVGGVLARALDEAGACLAAEMVGVSQRCLDMTVEYAKERVQFGVPIGSFQAVKHRCADMLVDLEHSRSAAYVAACRAMEPDAETLAGATSLALAECGDFAARIGKDTIQLHGGIGFTWEHDAHLFVRRAQASRQLLGGGSWHRERIWSLGDTSAEVSV